jgi:hypothetical protein
MISQMFIGIVVDDVPEFVIKGELERNNLFKLYKSREHQVLKHDMAMELVLDGVDKDKARRTLDDWLSGKFRA